MNIKEFENHSLVSIIHQSQNYKKQSKKYAKPLCRYNDLTDRLLLLFLRKATCEDIAYYFMGIQRKTYNDMPSVLYRLNRYYCYELPSTGDVLSSEFWQKWSINHAGNIQDFAKFWCEYK
jgi:prolyl-tRNA synthetase